MQLVVEGKRVELFTNGRSNKVPVPSRGATAADSTLATPRQVRAAVRGIIRGNHELSRQQPLYPETPLVDVRILSLGGAQVILIGKPPVRQWTVFFSLGSWQSVGKRVREGSRQGLKVIVGEVDHSVFAES